MAIIEPYPKKYKVGSHNGYTALMVPEEYVTSKRYRGEEDKTGVLIIPDDNGPLTHFRVTVSGKHNYNYQMFCFQTKVFKPGDYYTRSVVDGKIRFEKV